jgi:hypothetical protein
MSVYVLPSRCPSPCDAEPFNFSLQGTAQHERRVVAGHHTAVQTRATHPHVYGGLVAPSTTARHRAPLTRVRVARKELAKAPLSRKVQILGSNVNSRASHVLNYLQFGETLHIF